MSSRKNSRIKFLSNRKPAKISVQAAICPRSADEFYLIIVLLMRVIVVSF